MLKWNRNHESKDGRFYIVPIYRGCETAQEYKLFDNVGKTERYYPTVRVAKEAAAEEIETTLTPPPPSR